MSKTEQDAVMPKPGDAVASDVAWPGRVVSSFLGAPSCSDKAVDDRFRYRACQRCAKSVAPINLAMNTFLMILKGYLGVVGRSSALVADAIHSAADVVSAIMLIFGLRVSTRPRDDKYPFGRGKVEFLVALAIYTSLIAAGVVIFINAISIIVHKEEVTPSTTTLWGALISIIINEMMFRQSVCAGSQLSSPSLVANAWEKRGDALSSLAVFLGILGAILGCSFLDPLAAILVAFYILKSSLVMIWAAFKGLLDSALPSEMLDEIRQATLGVKGVVGIRRLRTREAGQVAWIDLEVFVDGTVQMGDATDTKDAVLRAVDSAVERASHITVYLRPSRS